VHFLQGEEVLPWLRAQEGARVWRYRPNVISLWVLAGAALLCLGLAARAWATSTTLWAGLSAAGLWTLLATLCAWGILHVVLFAVRSWVAIVPSGLVLGRGSRAAVVPRSVLRERRAAQWSEMQQRGWVTSLPLEVHGWQARLHLVSLFSHLHQLASFVPSLLALTLPEDGGEDAEQVGLSADGGMEEPSPGERP
jgi:hypothetical protein